MIRPLYIIMIGMHYITKKCILGTSYYLHLYSNYLLYIKYFHWMVNGRHEISR